MDLTIYDVIKGPVITEKAYELNQKLKKLVLWVHPAANKPLIAQAFKKIFNVDVDNVRIVVRKGKQRRVGRRVVQGTLKKKAIVTLVEGQSLNFLEQQTAPQQNGE